MRLPTRLTNWRQPSATVISSIPYLPPTLYAHFRRFAAHAHRTNYEMQKVYLRNAADSEELHINFRYSNASYSVERDFNFCRNVNENVNDALIRIRNNVEKELNKRSKKNKQKKKPQQPEAAATAEQVTAPVPQPVGLEENAIEFLRAGCEQSIKDVSFAEMLSVPDALQLKVLEQCYDVVVNQPWVANLVLPSCILGGYKVYPSKVEMQFAERAHCQTAWYKAKMPNSGDLQKGAVWLPCGNGFSYNTSNADVDHYLKFVLTPGNAAGQLGPAVENITKQPVQAGPGICPFETRHCFSAQRLSGQSFRMISYNILADLYADSDYTRTHLFPYCPAYALKIEYRRQLFLKEIIGYNADIICLQEVDMKIFDLDLRVVLEAPELGYQGVMAQKGTSGEGVATFFSLVRFELVRTHELNIGEQIPNLPAFAQLWERIKDNAKLVERICERATTLQLTLLKCKEQSRYLLVANTHLYFHPDADHIRLLQFGFSMLYVQYMRERLRDELKVEREEDIALVYCGDFNSVPECGIYKLMTERFVDEDFIDWSSNQDEAVKQVSLRQPYNMKSACGTPPYTNYTHAFAACLDYIFYESDRLAVQQVIPLPSEDELKAHIAIPSVVFPSDHVALVADLEFL